LDSACKVQVAHEGQGEGVKGGAAAAVAAVVDVDLLGQDFRRRKGHQNQGNEEESKSKLTRIHLYSGKISFKLNFFAGKFYFSR